MDVGVRDVFLDFYNRLDDIYYCDNAYVKALLNKGRGLRAKFFRLKDDFRLLGSLLDVKGLEKFIEFLVMVRDVVLCPVEFVDGYFYGVQARGLGVKKFYNLLLDDRFPFCFGLYDFGDFRFGEGVLLVEGIKDVMVCKYFYKYSIAMLTLKMSVKLYEYISAITNKVFLILDNDRSGRSLLYRKEYSGFNKYLLYSKDCGEYFDSGDKRILDNIEVIINGFIKKI